MSVLSSLATAAGLSRPKKKFHFDVIFTLEELKNLTFLTGAIFSKIRLRDGGAFSVLSNSCEVKSHCVKWNQCFQFHTKMYGSPTTGELEPCCCKVSIRQETKGGKSYKKLGYVKINLAEYAGAGAMQRKYLLESYNESKHKPDNSILQVSIALKQTSGDSLFKVPQVAAHDWELSENPADEGIQPDIHFRNSYTSRASAISTSTGTFNLGGGSLQDIRHQNEDERKTNSASNLRRPSLSDVTDPTANSIMEEPSRTEDTHPGSCDHTPRNLSPRPLFTHKTNRSSSFNNGGDTTQHVTELPPSGLMQHRRLGSWSQAGGTHTPPHATHRRQHSLMSGQSSKSTSAYSTLSERSGGSGEGGDVESMSGSLRGRLKLLATSSRVEQSRVDPQAVIDNLFSGHTFDSQEEGKEDGLKIYVDKNFGTVTVAGTNLDRKNANLRAIDVNEHKSTSPKRRHKRSSHSHMSRELASHSREASTHEQSPPPAPLPAPPPLQSSSSSSSACQFASSRSGSASSTKTLTATR